MNNSNALAEIQSKYPNCNLLLPSATSVQINPFYKCSVMEVVADTAPNSGDIFSVGKVKTGEDGKGKAIYEDAFSPAKPLLMKLATAAGIQFHPEYTTVTRENTNTYVGKAYGAVRLPDGSYKTHMETKRICLDDEESKYRLEFMDKSIMGIHDWRAAKAASEMFKGEWKDDPEKTNQWGKQIFSERYLRGEDYNDLKACLEPVVQRTLRKEVAEYIQFSERKEMTIDFELSPMEIELYVMVNNYLKKEILYALPNSHRTLITSVIRKLLASSSMAVAETFKVLKGRLETLKETTRTESADESIDFFLSFFDDDEIETDDDSKQDELYTREKVNEFIQHEIDEVTAIINKAESIKRNAKMTALKQAVETAFAFQDEAGIKQRIVVFTESIRTQQYMFEELSHAGYEGQILKFNGSTNDPVTKQIYKAWKARNYGKYVGSRNVELKNAIVEAFRDEYKILLVTDSGSEGLNLQFCNTIINYDLPWNPQKIEQRIGRCHRYGQKNDVVVINLLNTQNVADKRVYEILSEKFELFQGVFGASDKAIGLLESGADFEKRVTLIYQECKTTSDFTKQFKNLEKELEKKRNKKKDELKSIFTYKTEEQHKSHFNIIMKEIAEYDSQFKYWNSRSKEENEIYPKYYETNIDLEIPGIQHGYLLIGSSYVGEILEDAVFEIIDITGKIYGVSDELARELCEKLQEQCLGEKTPNNQEILSYIDKVDEFMQQKYAESKRTVLIANQKKLDNWLQLRKEEYLLRVKDTSELDELKDKYVNESDFRQKIALKKQIEILEEQKQKMVRAFHNEMSTLEEKAVNMQKQFAEGILVKTQLVTKIVIKF